MPASPMGQVRSLVWEMVLGPGVEGLLPGRLMDLGARLESSPGSTAAPCRRGARPVGLGAALGLSCDG